MSSPEPGTVRLQRVVVHAVLRSGPRLLVVPEGPGGALALPAAVLGHGESPGQGLRRALSAAGVGAVRTGQPVEARSVVAAHPGPDGEEVDVHTVHLVHSVQLLHGGHLGATARGAEDGRWVQAARLPGLPVAPDATFPVTAAQLPAPVPAGDGEVAVRRQRLAAYAVVVDDGRLLLTRLSERTPSPGRWTLPGGGVDHGEHPCVAAVREVHEETGNHVEVDELVEVGSEHFTGRSPAGVLEDFHALRVIVTATAPDAVEPVVLDVGGSTDLARWVPLGEAPALGLVGVAARGLQIARRSAALAEERTAGA
ncbi:ADP-ribose pyrophosphatase YjhB (NUDIX family) [Kineococcus xinjiangensis]|uniref:ADP-ribose pyrophosphatase YjhB (NUDIX family) n=1 Tax=Kineococcus xinjiangensis TaxID=512762 RepID=A0A2S6ITM8_9ACTN|nr:NUDIX domain-containing protein [Kineococcus xinjiangensis]PPK97607.1 ADP-ribose pyrophosphatase YjhB (NUDIX family) [Kineococcus xinjiangensis]